MVTEEKGDELCRRSMAYFWSKSARRGKSNSPLTMDEAKMLTENVDVVERRKKNGNGIMTRASSAWDGNWE